VGPLSNPYFEVLLLFIAPGTIVSFSHGERQPQAWPGRKNVGGTKRKNKKNKKEKKREVWTTTVIENNRVQPG
jgi:hypothetical protein